MKRVYIAGPISKGDMLKNIQQSDAAFVALVSAGFAPLNPMWSVFAGGIYRTWDKDGWHYVAEASAVGSLNLTHEQWLGIDLPWVKVADGVLRLPGESTGADREVAHAINNAIPVAFVGDLVTLADAIAELKRRLS